MARIQRIASRLGIKVADRFRQGLAHARRLGLFGEVARKIEVVRAAARHQDVPSGDIDVMLAEIESGYNSGQPWT